MSSARHREDERSTFPVTTEGVGASTLVETGGNFRVMDAIRIRCRIDSTTLESPDLVDFLGRDVEVIVLGERESREDVAQRRRQMLGSERDAITVSADFDQTPDDLIEEFEQGGQ